MVLFEVTLAKNNDCVPKLAKNAVGQAKPYQPLAIQQQLTQKEEKSLIKFMKFSRFYYVFEKIS